MNAFTAFISCRPACLGVARFQTCHVQLAERLCLCYSDVRSETTRYWRAGWFLAHWSHVRNSTRRFLLTATYTHPALSQRPPAAASRYRSTCGVPAAFVIDNAERRSTSGIAWASGSGIAKICLQLRASIFSTELMNQDLFTQTAASRGQLLRAVREVWGTKSYEDEFRLAVFGACLNHGLTKVCKCVFLCMSCHFL